MDVRSDAAVLGSAIHNQVWLPEAATFVMSHVRELAIRPVWLFSVGSVGDTSSFFGPRVERLFPSEADRDERGGRLPEGHSASRPQELRRRHRRAPVLSAHGPTLAG